MAKSSHREEMQSSSRHGSSGLTVSRELAHQSPAEVPCVRRRAFIDKLKRHVPVHAITVETAEIAGMIGGEKVAKGVVLPMMIS
jgi:hypothetical protein